MNKHVVNLDPGGDTKDIPLQLATVKDIMNELVKRNDPFVFMVDRDTFGEETVGGFHHDLDKVEPVLQILLESYEDARRQDGQ